MPFQFQNALRYSEFNRLRESASVWIAMHRGLPRCTFHDDEYCDYCGDSPEACLVNANVCGQSLASIVAYERQIAEYRRVVANYRRHECTIRHGGSFCYRCDDISYYSRLVNDAERNMAGRWIHVHCSEDSDEHCTDCNNCVRCCSCIRCNACSEVCTESYCAYCGQCEDCCECNHCNGCGTNISDRYTSSCSECDTCSGCCECTRCGYCGDRNESLCEEDRCSDCCSGECGPDVNGLDRSEHGTRTDIEEFVERIGCEIEFHFGSDGGFGKVLRALKESGLEVLDRRNTHAGSSLTMWTLKRDGSVNNGGELVSPILHYGNHETEIAKALSALRDSECTVDYATGIHIHVEARNEDLSYFDSDQIQRVARMCYRNEDAIFRIATAGDRHRGTSYCRPFPERHTRNGADYEYMGRYYGCNLQSFYSRGTIEFRYFDSHFDSGRLASQIDLCIAIIRNARAKRLISRCAYPAGYVRNAISNARYLGDENNGAAECEAMEGIAKILRRGLDGVRMNHVVSYLCESVWQDIS